MDINDLHVPKEFSIPLKGSALQVNNEIGRLQKYVNCKREEVAKKKEAARKKDSPAMEKRGYSTPFTSLTDLVTSPTDIMNTTIDLIETNESYEEDDTNIYDGSAQPWENMSPRMFGT